jgi:hypothetical protein
LCVPAATRLLSAILFALPAVCGACHGFYIGAGGSGRSVFGKRAILQYIAFLFLFGALMANVNKQKNETLAVIIDPYGIRTMTTVSKT